MHTLVQFLLCSQGCLDVYSEPDLYLKKAIGSSSHPCFLNETRYPKGPQLCSLSTSSWSITRADNDWPEKDNLAGGCWVFASSQVSLNSIQRSQRTSRKCLIQSETRAAISLFWSARENTGLVEDIGILLPVKCRWFYSAVAEKNSKMYQPITGWGNHLSFPIGPTNTNWADDVEIFLPVKFRWILFSCCWKGKSKMPQPIRGYGDHLRFPIGPKNTNFEEDVEIIPLSTCAVQRFQRNRKCEKLKTTDEGWLTTRYHNSAPNCPKVVENVSNNQRPGRPSWFYDRSKQHWLNVRWCWDLSLSCFVDFV